jgi:hypothetical protein
METLCLSLLLMAVTRERWTTLTEAFRRNGTSIRFGGQTAIFSRLFR